MHKHPGIRDQMVIATKYTTSFSSYKGHDGIIQSNTGGNGSKSLHVSIRNSLHKLKTDYIDVLYVQYVHFRDYPPHFPLQLSRSQDMFRKSIECFYCGNKYCNLIYPLSKEAMLTLKSV